MVNEYSDELWCWVAGDGVSVGDNLQERVRQVKPVMETIARQITGRMGLAGQQAMSRAYVLPYRVPSLFQRAKQWFFETPWAFSGRPSPLNELDDYLVDITAARERAVEEDVEPFCAGSLTFDPAWNSNSYVFVKPELVHRISAGDFHVVGMDLEEHVETVRSKPKTLFKRIVVPVVRTESSYHVFQTALDIAQRNHGSISIHFIGVPDQQPMLNSVRLYPPNQVWEFKKRIETISDWIRHAERRGVMAYMERVQSAEDMFERISGEKKDNPLDLIIMEQRWLKDFYWSKVLPKLYENSNCPILFLSKRKSRVSQLLREPIRQTLAA